MKTLDKGAREKISESCVGLERERERKLLAVWQEECVQPKQRPCLNLKTSPH